MLFPKPAAVLAAAAGLAAAAIAVQAQSAAKEPPPQIARGEYLVAIMGCNDCHTPMKLGPKGPEKDMAKLLSGHPERIGSPAPPELPKRSPWGMVATSSGTAYAGPWGVTFAANLTPDVNTGIGIWTEEMFIAAMREGRHMGQSRPIMPPMPWQSCARLTDEDIKALFAYLKSVPAISNRVPEYVPPPGQKAEALEEGKGK